MQYRFLSTTTRPSQLPPRAPPQIKPNPSRPIAITSPLLTYIWSSHQHYREHNTHLTKLHGAKNAAFANALSVPRYERRPQPGDFKYSLYGPFGKHYGQLVRLHAWKGAEIYWGECMLRIWGLVKSQAWAAQRDEKRMGKLREEEERAWEAVDMLGEIRKNLKEEILAGGERDSVQGGATESEFSNLTRGMEFSSDGDSAHTDTSAAGPSGNGEVIVEEDADSSESSVEEGPEPLPSWVQAFVRAALTYNQKLNYNDLPSWAIPVVNSLPQEPSPIKTSSDIPLSLYSPFHQHHTTLVLDPTPVESAYPASHTLVLYHHVLTRHPTLSQEAHDGRTLPFLRGPPDVMSTPLRNLRFNSFDFLFRASLRRHIGKARRGLDAVKEQGEESKARRENVDEKEPEKWGRWSQWEKMVVEGEISPPGLGRFRGYMGQKLWRLKNPGRKYYGAPITQQRWSKDRSEPDKAHKKPERARVPEGKVNWVEEVLMSTTDPEPQVEAGPITLAPELEKALDILFEKPRGKTHDVAPVVTTVEDESEAAGLPKADGPAEKRPIQEEFNEVMRLGRGYLSLKRESKVSTMTDLEIHVEKMDVKSVEETIKISTVQSMESEGISTLTEHKQAVNKVTDTFTELEMEHKHMEREHRAMDGNLQDNRARESGAEWLSGVLQDVPITEPNTSTFRRRRTGRNTLTSPRPPFLATDVFPPQFSEMSSPPQSDPVSSATFPSSSPESQSHSHPRPAEGSFENWAIKTGLFRFPADRDWAHVDLRTQPPAPRSDRETKWTVHLAERMSSSSDGQEDLMALQRELELVRRKISTIKGNEWWKRNRGPQVGSADCEEGVVLYMLERVIHGDLALCIVEMSLVKCRFCTQFIRYSQQQQYTLDKHQTRPL
ncbi:hypothetical protein EV426DRAFT_367377 [Tirmania nivea]|nr:hypothetical protein EV426DRAFT_367377 [Tirmania nivea]